MLKTHWYQIGAAAVKVALWLSASGQALSQEHGDDRPRIAVVRTKESVRIDGRLDEVAWRDAAVTTSLVQREPQEGSPVTESTKIHLLMDDQYLYIAIRCDDRNIDQVVANEMRRDASLLDNDCVEIYLDTYHDHRSAFYFATNPLGAQRDGIITADVSEEEQNWDWNGVWQNSCSVDTAGWTAEFAIPFQTLRFQQGENAIWGLNIARFIPRKREEAYWTTIKREFGWNGKFRISSYGHLLGLGILSHRGDFEFKPFILAGTERDYEDQAKPAFRRGLGLDAKYHLTPNLTADISVNTDFAQVEADQEQTNLTRFELLFPEKRDFFLEGASIFRFGERMYSPLMPASVLFFSRRIGLSEDNTIIPLLGGVKMTGKVGGLAVGALNMTADRSRYRNDDEMEVSVPRTNFSIVRFRHDILANSSVGVIGLNKQSLDDGAFNRGFGADANIYLSPNTQVGGFVAKSLSPGMKGNDLAAYGDLLYGDDLFSLLINHNTIQDNFNPEMGYFQRTGIRRSEISVGLSPRPKLLNLRQVTVFGDIHYIENQQGEVEARYSYAGLWSQFADGAYLLALAAWNYENLTEAFDLSDAVTIVPAEYHFTNLYAEFGSDKSKPFSGTLLTRFGQFYDGSLTGYGGTLNLKLGSHITWNIQGERNIIDVSAGNVSTTLLGTRFTYAFTPRLFAKAFIQWNSEEDLLTANVLVNFIHTPGSDLFLVYNEELSTGSGRTATRYRTLLLKFTYLFSI